MQTLLIVILSFWSPDRKWQCFIDSNFLAVLMCHLHSVWWRIVKLKVGLVLGPACYFMSHECIQLSCTLFWDGEAVTAPNISRYSRPYAQVRNCSWWVLIFPLLLNGNGEKIWKECFHSFAWLGCGCRQFLQYISILGAINCAASRCHNPILCIAPKIKESTCHAAFKTSYTFAYSNAECDILGNRSFIYWRPLMSVSPALLSAGMWL